MSVGLNKAKKKDFTKNNPKEDNDQALVFGTDHDKCARVGEDMSLSRSSKSLRLWQKFRFLEKREEKVKDS